MPLGLQIQMEEIEKKVVARIEGRIDAASAPTLEKRLMQLINENHTDILVDFAQVDYLSSAGMRVLLATTKKLRAEKGSLILFSLHDDVAQIIRMAGLDKILLICQNERAALQFGK